MIKTLWRASGVPSYGDEHRQETRRWLVNFPYIDDVHTIELHENPKRYVVHYFHRNNKGEHYLNGAGDVASRHMVYDPPYEFPDVMNRTKPPATKSQRPSWAEYGLLIAEVVACRSEDPFRKVGAVLFRPDWSIASTGYNGAPPGIDFDNWDDREARRHIVIHAEMNALRYATRADFNSGGVLCCTHQPCEKCMPMLAANHIVNIYYREPYINPEGNFRPGDIEQMAYELGLNLNHWPKKDLPPPTPHGDGWATELVQLRQAMNRIMQIVGNTNYSQQGALRRIKEIANQHIR